MPKKFLRRTWSRYVKLGKGRKKKQKWRNPTGRDNKMRERRKGRPPVVSIGYRSDKKIRGTLQEKIPQVIMNIKDLSKVQKNQIAYLGNVGKKKKIEIANKAKEMKIEFYNLNIDSFLKKNKIKTKENKK
jgi:large subunit ribosomal protein L32e